MKNGFLSLSWFRINLKFIALKVLITWLGIGSIVVGCTGFGDRFADREIWLADQVYWSDVKPIFDRYCNSCHGEILAAGAPFPLLTYSEVLPYLERIEIRVFESEDMPPGGLRVEESKELLSRWLEQGAFFDAQGYGEFEGGMMAGNLNRTGGELGGTIGDVMGGDIQGDLTEGMGDDSSLAQPTWRNSIKEKFDIYCNTCHASPPTGGAPFPLLTYEQVIPFLNRFQVRVFERKDMPPGGIQDEDDLKIIQEWINLGGPQ